VREQRLLSSACRRNCIELNTTLSSFLFVLTRYTDHVISFYLVLSYVHEHLVFYCQTSTRLLFFITISSIEPRPIAYAESVESAGPTASMEYSNYSGPHVPRERYVEIITISSDGARPIGHGLSEREGATIKNIRMRLSAVTSMMRKFTGTSAE
jgi:hypothetical protein